MTRLRRKAGVRRQQDERPDSVSSAARRERKRILPKRGFLNLRPDGSPQTSAPFRPTSSIPRTRANSHALSPGSAGYRRRPGSVRQPEGNCGRRRKHAPRSHSSRHSMPGPGLPTFRENDIRPTATGSIMKVTKWPKPADSMSRTGHRADMQAVERIAVVVPSCLTMALGLVCYRLPQALPVGTRHRQFPGDQLTLRRPPRPRPPLTS